MFLNKIKQFIMAENLFFTGKIIYKTRKHSQFFQPGQPKSECFYNGITFNPYFSSNGFRELSMPKREKVAPIKSGLFPLY